MTSTTTDLDREAPRPWEPSVGEACPALPHDGASFLGIPRPIGRDTSRTLVSLPVDGVAWAEVVTLVRRQMQSFVGGGSRRDLDDLTQTALERIYRSVERFEGRAQFATYTYRVCASVALNHWRWYKRWLRRFERATEDTPEPEASDCDAVAHAIERERLLRLTRALERLTPIKRAVLTLCELEELPASRVSEILGCPEPTVRSRLHQARIDLARILRDDESFFEAESERSK